jgi:hypothetical protein
MAAVGRVVADGLSILGALVSAYLALGVGLALLGGQLDAVTGRPSARDIVQRVVYLVLCIALIAFAQGIKNDLAAIVGDEVGNAAAMRAAYLGIARYFLTIIIGAASILLAVGIVTGFVGAQVATMAGEAFHLSEVLARTLMVAALGVGAILTVSISNAIIDAIR